MERPQRLTAAFVEKIDQPGRYSDGRGSHGLTLLVRPRMDGMAKNWAQQLRVNGKLRSFGLGSIRRQLLLPVLLQRHRTECYRTFGEVFN